MTALLHVPFALLAEEGIRVLRNESARRSRAHRCLLFAGVDDTYTGRADVAAAMAREGDSCPGIALAHAPRSFPELARRAAALVFSGHTHPGPIAQHGAWVGRLARGSALPWSRWRHRWRAGLDETTQGALVISAGLGTTGHRFASAAPRKSTWCACAAHGLLDNSGLALRKLVPARSGSGLRR